MGGHHRHHDEVGPSHCADLLRDVDDLLHGELDPTRAAALQAHLHDCPPCLETADFQAQLRRLLTKRCGEPVPQGFEARLLAALSVEGLVLRRDSVDPGAPS